MKLLQVLSALSLVVSISVVAQESPTSEKDNELILDETSLSMLDPFQRCAYPYIQIFVKHFGRTVEDDEADAALYTVETIEQACGKFPE